jgi:hypothetical protein
LPRFSALEFGNPRPPAHLLLLFKKRKIDNFSTNNARNSSSSTTTTTIVEESRIFSTKEENQTRQSSNPNTTTCTRAHESPARHTQKNGVPERKQRAQPKSTLPLQTPKKRENKRKIPSPRERKKKPKFNATYYKFNK